MAGVSAINCFDGDYRFLSNFYPWIGRRRIGGDITVVYDGIVYRTAEHAFVAAKTMDPLLRRTVASIEFPGEAKRFGRGLRLRPSWDEVKVNIMFVVVMDKFLRNPDLGQRLIATGAAPLIEGNTWGDTFWGKVDGFGLNHLGQVLEAVRSVLAGNGL